MSSIKCNIKSCKNEVTVIHLEFTQFLTLCNYHHILMHDVWSDKKKRIMMGIEPKIIKEKVVFT